MRYLSNSRLALGVAAALTLSAAPSSALTDVERALPPNLTGRDAAIGDRAALGPVVAAHLDRLLSASKGDAAVYVDEETGSVRAIYAVGGALSASVEGTPEAIAWAFLKAHHRLFDAAYDDLDELAVSRVFDSPNGGLTHVYFEQTHDGVPVFNAEVRIHLDASGQVTAVQSGWATDLGHVADLDLTAAQAVLRAATDIERDPATLPALPDGASDDELRIVDDGDPMGFGLRARRVVFPSVTGGRPAWSIGIGLDGAPPAYYNVVVDGITGKTLARVNRVAYAGGMAFTGPHPPMGGACPVGPPLASVSFDATPESPNGYVEPGLGGTRGNNVRAHEDVANQNFGAMAPPTAPSRWDYPWTDAYATSGNAATDRNAAITSLFYMNNYIHDRLYSRGFDEPSENFQVENFGRGGLGGDEVWADAQDGSGLNNANFGTPDEGDSPRMQMYLWTGPNRDGDVDNTVVVHEYGHGVSHRLVGVNCLGGVEAGAMGEGWGDFLACSFFDVPIVGAYATNNCTRGIRSASYDPALFIKDYGNVCQGGCQVHRDGEVWAATLWDMRERIAASVGDRDVAACIAETLVIEGMKQTACNPTMLNARDGILAAARERHPELQCLIWETFADAGMGFAATSNGGSGGGSRVLDYNAPANCTPCPLSTPVTGLVADTSVPNQVGMTWNATPGAIQYHVYVTDTPCGTACSAPSRTLLGSSPTPNYTDATVSGQLSRTYIVRAALNGLCVGPEACAEVTPTGECTVRPTFTLDAAGATHVVPTAVTGCELEVHWTAATTECPGRTLLYNVYRSTVATFTPTLANLIASVPSPATSYIDATGLASGTTYYYIVRAEDTSSGGTGPNGGNEDNNLARRANSPRGVPTGVTDFLDTMDPAPAAGWTSTVLPAVAPNDWTPVNDANSGGTQAWHTVHRKGVDYGSAFVIHDLYMPPMSITAASQLTFDHKVQTENQWDGGIVEISVDGGTTWRDLSPSIVSNGYNDITLSMETYLQEEANNRIWTGTIPAGFGSFRSVVVDLSSFAPTRDALIRFRALWDYDSPAGTFNGWYIDNVQVSAVEQFDVCSAPGCATAPSRIEPMYAVRVGDDAVFSWPEDTDADGGYRLYKTENKTLIALQRDGTADITVGATTAQSTDTTLTDTGAVPGPPTNPGLWHYQVLGVCSDGVTEGPN